MTSSRGEFVQNAIDSAIASRNIDIYNYLNSSRTPILEQPDAEPAPVSSTAQQVDNNLNSITDTPVQENMASATEAAVVVAPSTNLSNIIPSSSATHEPDLQKVIDYAIQNAIDAPTVDIYDYLEKTNPVAPPRNKNIFTEDDQTPAKDSTLRQEETPVLSDNVQNAIQSAVKSGGIEPQSYLKGSTSITSDTTPSAVDNTINNKFNSDDPIENSIGSAVAAPSASCGVREPQHSETASTQKVDLPTSSNLSSEIDNALEKATNVSGSSIQEENAQPTPPLPPKEPGLQETLQQQDQKPSVLDKMKDRSSELKDNIKESVGHQDVSNNGDDDDVDNRKNNMKDSAKTAAAAIGASAAAATAGFASFAEEKKDKLKSKINEKKEQFNAKKEEYVNSNSTDNTEEQSSAANTITLDKTTNVTDDPLNQNKQLETDISGQTITEDHTDSNIPPPEPSQFKPVPPEPKTNDESIQDKPVPPEPEGSNVPFETKPTPPEPAVTTQNEVVPNESTLSEPVSQSKPIQSENSSPEATVTRPKSPEVPNTSSVAPEPPVKHHHGKLLPTKPGHDSDEKSKKCRIM